MGCIGMGLEEPRGRARQRTVVSRGEEAGRHPRGRAGRSVARGCGETAGPTGKGEQRVSSPSLTSPWPSTDWGTLEGRAGPPSGPGAGHPQGWESGSGQLASLRRGPGRLQTRIPAPQGLPTRPPGTNVRAAHTHPSLDSHIHQDRQAAALLPLPAQRHPTLHSRGASHTEPAL